MNLALAAQGFKQFARTRPLTCDGARAGLFPNGKRFSSLWHRLLVTVGMLSTQELIIRMLLLRVRLYKLTMQVSLLCNMS